mgnify:CR=1 FL=1
MPISMNTFPRALLLSLAFGLASHNTALLAKDLPMAKPESVGISSKALEKINDFTAKNIEQGKHIGFVTMVARHGKIVHYEAVGKFGLDNEKAIEKDSLFRIYSMTKPITTVAAMMLYEEGNFHLSDPVAKYIPELKDLKLLKDGEEVQPQSQITIEQLMSHTAGLTYGFTRDNPVNIAYQDAKLFESKDLNEMMTKLGGIPLRFEPGSRYYYSVATDVLGALVERISGMSLEQFFEQRIFTPLGMDDTLFSVPKDKVDRFVSNHVWDYEAQKISLLPPEYQRSYTDTTLFSGGGGLVSTAMDYMIFCEMLRRGGTYNGVRILGPKTIQFMTMNHLTDEVRNEGAHEYPSQHLYPGQSFGLGFGVITHPGLSQVTSSKGEYSWGGAADTKFWIDPEEDLVVILMTQLMRAPWETRYQIKTAVYQALDSLGSQ